MLVIFGRGGHARVVEECASTLGYGRIDLVDEESLKGHKLSDRYPPQAWKVHVAIGDNRVRERIFNECRDQGFKFLTFVHKTAYVSRDVEVGAGVFIAAMACVMVGAKIEDGAILNTGCVIDHDGYIQKFSHIAPGAKLCGDVRVGERALVGVGSSVIPKIKIGPDSVIAGGSSVISDVPAGILVAGNPAKIKK